MVFLGISEIIRNTGTGNHIIDPELYFRIQIQFTIKSLLICAGHYPELDNAGSLKNVIILTFYDSKALA